LDSKGAVCHVYDFNGQRIRKVHEHSGLLVEERFYLGNFEVYRKHSGAGLPVVLERQTLHIMNEEQRVAMVERRTIDTQGVDRSPEQLRRYHFGNHLGSSTLELDDQAYIISYEEYYPYGSTSYQAMRNDTEASKRYRYTGKERDDESGLYYYGARYYAPWVGRWISCDPVGIVSGSNLYLFVSGNPIRNIDNNGLWETDMHFAGVYWSGRMMGATHDLALKVAIASQALDDYEDRSAPGLKKQAAAYRVGEFRAPEDKNGERGILGDFAPTPFETKADMKNRRANNSHSLNVTREQSEEVARLGIKEKDAFLFGLGLHAVGDYLPHANITGISTWGHFWGKTETGEESRMHEHAADKTNLNPKKALATFMKFRQLWHNFLGNEGPAKPMSKTELELVELFIYSKTEEQKIEVLRKIDSADFRNMLLFMADKSMRTRYFEYMKSTSGASLQKAESNWDSRPNDDIFNSKKVDISEDLKGQPEIADPFQRYEAASPKIPWRF
jgi:RHS repeat-associated protein